MPHITFEWDEKKRSLNKRKHGASFEEAQTVFADDNALLLHDPDHSHDEDRFVLLDLSSELRLLVVSHTYRRDDGVIRIIFARKQPFRSKNSSGAGGKHEKGIRFFKSQQKPLCEPSKKASHYQA